MAATLEIDELNQTGSTTHGILNMNVGAVDQPNISVSAKTALVQGKNAYIKYNQLHFTALNGVTTIANLRTWMLGSIGVETTVCSFGGTYTPAVFTTPTQNALVGGLAYPVTTPALANLGINGLIANTITSGGFGALNTSDLYAWQVQTPANIGYGYIPTKTFMFSWDET